MSDIVQLSEDIQRALRERDRQRTRNREPGHYPAAIAIALEVIADEIAEIPDGIIHVQDGQLSQGEIADLAQRFAQPGDTATRCTCTDAGGLVEVIGGRCTYCRKPYVD